MGRLMSDTGLLLAYIDDMRIRRMSDNTIRTRIVVARMLAAQYDPLRVNPDQMRAMTRAWAALTPQTHSSYVQHVRDLFAFMERAGLRDDNPAADLPRPRVPRHLPRPITEPDLAVALAAAQPKMHAWLVLGAYAGLRCCEIAALDRADLLEQAIRVRGKGDKERVIPVGVETLRAVRRAGLPRTGVVFRTRDGRPYRARRVSEKIAGFLRGHGVDATAHQLRHRYATRMLELSGDIRLVQELLGHESVATTQVYTAYSRPAASRAVAALDALLGG